MCTVYSKEHINPANKNKFHIIAIGYSSPALPRPRIAGASRQISAIPLPLPAVDRCGRQVRQAGIPQSASIVVIERGLHLCIINSIVFA